MEMLKNLNIIEKMLLKKSIFSGVKKILKLKELKNYKEVVIYIKDENFKILVDEIEINFKKDIKMIDVLKSKIESLGHKLKELVLICDFEKKSIFINLELDTETLKFTI